MVQGLEEDLANKRKEDLLHGKPTLDKPEDILDFRPRVEKLVTKDVKMRTFITDDEHRDDMVAHVYDTTYEVIRKKVDTIVVLDDSIVRGTTLEKSILRLLDTIDPKKIVIVSSAPQIRFPDCYGIDMSKFKDFVAFRAVLSLIKKKGMETLLDEVYEKCRASENDEVPVNHVKEIFEPFSYEEVSNEIARIVTPDDIEAEVQVVYQIVDNLHKACPMHLGDWYFTGNYPTPGGNRVVNKAFVNFMEGKLVRAY
jgi:amidophosphoribosyltransferase